MKIKIITVGKAMPKWVEIAYAEYTKRLSPHLKLELLEIALQKRPKNADIDRLITIECKQMLAHIHETDAVTDHA